MKTCVKLSKLSRVTPDSLSEAIMNGYLEFREASEANKITSETVADFIEPHIREYISQPLSTALINSGDSPIIKTLWEEIIGEKL